MLYSRIPLIHPCQLILDIKHNVDVPWHNGCFFFTTDSKVVIFFLKKKITDHVHLKGKKLWCTNIQIGNILKRFMSSCYIFYHHFTNCHDWFAKTKEWTIIMEIR